MPEKSGRVRKMSIRHKIILTIYLVLFPVLILAELFIYFSSFRSATQENTRTYQKLVSSLDDNITFVEKDLMDITTYFCVNDDIIGLLGSRDLSVADADPLFWKRNAPTGFVNDMLSIKSHIRTLVLYPENGLPPYYVSRDSTVHNLNIESLRETEIYGEAVTAKGDHVWRRVDAGDQSAIFLGNRSDKIVICREIYDMSKARRLGFLALSIDVEWYERTCAASLQRPNESICLLGSGGEILAQVGDADAETIAAAYAGETSRGWSSMLPPSVGPYYVFTEHREVSGETILYLSPKANWNEWLTSGLIMPAVLAAALLLGIWPLSAMASRYVTRPLDRLYTSMNRFKDGDFEARVEVSGQDEVSEISATFNTMVHDLHELIDRNYVMVLRERESELNALQAQINPHFLYNALDSLYWEASAGEQEELAEHILSLSELFRMTLSSGQSVIPVEREISIVRHYLHIQKMRFAKKLDYTIDVDPGILHFEISKLILQPFVENAIVHGLERKDSWGFVSVSGALNGERIRFTVEDNGIGMPPQQVDSILNEDEEKRYANQRIGHYAIRNVKERLALRYGTNCELQIKSQPGKGTTVIIEIPAEVERYATNNAPADC